MRGANLIVVIVATTVAIATAQSEDSRFDRDAFIQCARADTREVCEADDMFAILRESLDAVVECNQTGIALTLATQCARDTDIGVYCSEAIFYSGRMVDLFTTCGFTAGTCSEACNSTLQEIRDGLGCCINAVVNNTIPNNPFSAFQRFFTNEMWVDTCGLEPITNNCTDILSFTIPTTPSSGTECSFGAQLTSELTPVCTPAMLERLNSLINENGDCDEYLEYAQQVCSVDENGDFCIATTTQDSDFTDFLVPIQTICTNPSQCSPECSALLERFVSTRGCCVNSLYNSTHSRAIGVPYSFLDNTDLFELCGVDTPPQMCELPTMPTLPTGGAIQIRGFTAMLLLPLIALMGLFI